MIILLHYKIRKTMLLKIETKKQHTLTDVLLYEVRNANKIEIITYEY